MKILFVLLLLIPLISAFGSNDTCFVKTTFSSDTVLREIIKKSCSCTGFVSDKKFIKKIRQPNRNLQASKKKIFKKRNITFYVIKSRSTLKELVIVDRNNMLLKFISNRDDHIDHIINFYVQTGVLEYGFPELTPQETLKLKRKLGKLVAWNKKNKKTFFWRHEYLEHIENLK